MEQTAANNSPSLAELLHRASHKYNTGKDTDGNNSHENNKNIVTPQDIYTCISNQPSALSSYIYVHNNEEEDSDLGTSSYIIMPIHYVMVHREAIEKVSGWSYKEVCFCFFVNYMFLFL